MAGNDVIVVHLDGDFDGWHATMRSPSRVSARVVIDIESDSNAKRLQAYAKLILSVEGWKDIDGNPTTDPLEGPLAAIEVACAKWGEQAAELPKA